MAGPVVTVDLKVRKKGAIVITVDPWEVHCTIGERVSWNFTGDIASGTTTLESTSRVSPFSGRKRSFKGTKRKNARSGKVRARRYGSVVVPYRVTVEFRDPTDQHLRTASVDPDMVIE